MKMYIKNYSKILKNDIRPIENTKKKVLFKEFAENLKVIASLLIDV